MNLRRRLDKLLQSSQEADRQDRESSGVPVWADEAQTRFDAALDLLTEVEFPGVPQRDSGRVGRMFAT